MKFHNTAPYMNKICSDNLTENEPVIHSSYFTVNYRSSSPSSSSNIQNQCLIITDVHGVREKGGVAEKRRRSATVYRSLCRCPS